jgi:hypothetical protein
MAAKKKETGHSPPPVPFQSCIRTVGPVSGAYPPLLGTYPLVTTGGRALPVPRYCAQPAMLRMANIAAVARASFFANSPMS